MHLVLIETSGNQNFIFSTNKLKENIGASELTYQAGTSWVFEAVAQVNNGRWNIWRNGEHVRDKLLNDELNQPIDESNNVKVEMIIAASGKALLLTQDDKIARSIIRYVTHKALREAPGLDICGVISEEFDWEKDSLGEFNRKVHQKFESVRSQRPSPTSRFLRLPVIEECATSGLPASTLDLNSDKKPVSAISDAKRRYNNEGFQRIRALLKRENCEVDLFRSVRALDEEYDLFYETQPENNEYNASSEVKPRKLEWLAVVHADGNGLGEIFLNFDKHINCLESNNSNKNRDYVNRLRKFSIALDICTEKAFLSAIDACTSSSKNLVPVIPLILGGDDLTVICDGKSALKFTQKFLIAFEDETAKSEYLDGIIPEIASVSLKMSYLSACAGVAITKAHFPTSVAYQLSEALTKSAKKVKEIVKHKSDENHVLYSCSALDFHVLYDSSNVELKQIRKKLEQNDEQIKLKLYGRPYVVTDEDKLKSADGVEWVKLHHWKSLEKQVCVLTDKEDGRRKLPNSQMHDLREGLFLGKESADARFKLICNRYRKKGILDLAGDENSLFLKEPSKEPNSEVYITGLLDALDVVGFLNEGDSNEQKEPKEA